MHVSFICYLNSTPVCTLNSSRERTFQNTIFSGIMSKNLADITSIWCHRIILKKALFIAAWESHERRHFCTVIIIMSQTGVMCCHRNQPLVAKHLHCLGWLLPRRTRSWTRWELGQLLALAACSRILDRSTGEAGTTRTRSPTPGPGNRCSERKEARESQEECSVSLQWI